MDCISGFVFTIHAYNPQGDISYKVLSHHFPNENRTGKGKYPPKQPQKPNPISAFF